MIIQFKSEKSIFCTKTLYKYFIYISLLGYLYISYSLIPCTNCLDAVNLWCTSNNGANLSVPKPNYRYSLYVKSQIRLQNLFGHLLISNGPTNHVFIRNKIYKQWPSDYKQLTGNNPYLVVFPYLQYQAFDGFNYVIGLFLYWIKTWIKCILGNKIL